MLTPAQQSEVARLRILRSELLQRQRLELHRLDAEIRLIELDCQHEWREVPGRHSTDRCEHCGLEKSV